MRTLTSSRGTTTVQDEVVQVAFLQNTFEEHTPVGSNFNAGSLDELVQFVSGNGVTVVVEDQGGVSNSEFV
jgi:hypothetical protein